MGARDLLERQVLADLVAALIQFEGRMTEMVEAVRGGALNHILYSGSVFIDAAGDPIQKSWVIPFAAFEIVNYSANAISVETSPMRDPTDLTLDGPGTFTIRANRAEVINAVGNVLTFYAAGNTRFKLTVYTKPVPPAYGS